MRCVGVLGGYGPLATAHFFEQVIKATPASRDWEHLHVIVNNNPKVPSRARAFLYGEEDPTGRMLEEVERLRIAGADFFVCPCNSAHYYLRQAERLPLPFVDMVEATLSRAKDSDYRNGLLLGSEVTMAGGVYHEPAAECGMEIRSYPDASAIRSIIEAGKTGSGLAEAEEKLSKIFDEARREYDCVILGCTELPLVLNRVDHDIPILDTAQILVEATVRYALR